MRPPLPSVPRRPRPADGPGAPVRSVLRRLGWSLLSLLAVAVFVFVATEVLPGDAAVQLAGPAATPAEIEQLRRELGLDRPALQRFGQWAADALRGELGRSLTSGRPVVELLAERLPNSLALSAAALLLAFPTALATGVRAGMREGGTADRLSGAASLAALAVPEFLATVLLGIVFARWLGWFPQVALVPLGGSPWQRPEGMVLPVLSLALLAFAVTTRTIRARVVDVVRSPYVEAARLGLGSLV